MLIKSIWYRLSAIRSWFFINMFKYISIFLQIIKWEIQLRKKSKRHFYMNNKEQNYPNFHLFLHWVWSNYGENQLWFSFYTLYWTLFRRGIPTIISTSRSYSFCDKYSIKFYNFDVHRNLDKFLIHLTIRVCSMIYVRH